MATKSAKAPPPRQKRTKAEVQQAFEEIQNQHSDDRQSKDAKAEELTRLQEQEVKAAFKDFTVETVVTRISDLSVQISRALGGISEQLSDEVKRLAIAREAVEIEKRELERLHKIDIAVTALDQLLEEHTAKNAEFEATATAKEGQWAEQIRTREREQKEFDDTLRRNRQREVEDYEYKKGLERKKLQDRYDEEQRLVERRNQERQEALDKSWEQRETALKEKEQELERLRKESQDFPARIQQEVRKAVSEALKNADVQHAQDKLILEKDSEAETRVAELRIKSLEETVAAQRAQIASFEKRLEEAKAQVQDIALKAIEGASGSRALAHVNQIAIEQAKQKGDR